MNCYECEGNGPLVFHDIVGWICLDCGWCEE